MRESLGRQPKRIALVMVGLPARGKTYIARKVARYLTWLGHRARVFNVGNYRRKHVGSRQPHDFFDPSNPEGVELRWQMARSAMADLVRWLDDGGEIAIYDATNSTHERRRWVVEECARHRIQPVFIESVCHDPDIIASNIRETKLMSPDYAGVGETDAVQDFEARIAHYERAYEPVDEDGVSWVKLIDVGRQVVLNNISGFLPSKLVFFLMNLHITPRPIWLTRHGESLDNVAGRIGGDSNLSPAGREYARRLASFMEKRAVALRPGPGGREATATPGLPARVWTSTLKRAIETAGPIDVPRIEWKSLDEIGAGICDGMTYEEIEEQFPEEWVARQSDKLRYRYPRGESYQDVIERLEPVIIELERQRVGVLVIAHQAVLRALYAYFMDHSPDDCPHLSVPLHTVIELTPKAYGCREERFALSAPGHPGANSA